MVDKADIERNLELRLINNEDEDLEKSARKPSSGFDKWEKLLGAMIIVTGVITISVFIFVVNKYYYYIRDLHKTRTDPMTIVRPSVDDFPGPVNEDVNPCDNFHQYACSRHKSNSLIMSHRFAVKKGKELIASPEKVEDTAWAKLTKRLYSKCIDETGSSVNSSSIVHYLKNYTKSLLHNQPPPVSELRPLSRDETVVRFLTGGKVKHYKYYYRYMTKILTLLGSTRENADAAAKLVIDFERKVDMKLEVSNYKSFLGRYSSSDGKSVGVINENGFPSLNTTFWMVNTNEMSYQWIDGLVDEPGYYYHVLWSEIDQLVPVMPIEFRTALAEYSNDDPGDVHLPDPLDGCYNLTSRVMNFAVADMILREIVDEKTRSELFEMIDAIKDELRNMIPSLGWHPLLSDRLIKKVQDIKVDYPLPRSVWQTITTKTISILAQNELQDSFMSHYLTAQNLVSELGFWRFLDLTLPNAAAAFDLLMFAGILMPPVFDRRQPTAFNYGGTGSIIAHELMHAIQQRKLLHVLFYYDDRAYSVDKEECLTKQYDQRFEFGVRQAYVSTTLEDFADQGSVIIAYNAYVNKMKKENGTNLPSVNDRKAFFKAFAQVWCDNFPQPRAMPVPLAYMDNHSQRRYRVNVPLSNFLAFSELMGCETGDAMKQDYGCLHLQQ